MIILVVLSGMVSLGVEVGRVQLAKAELQNAADAAARAAATSMLTSLSQARTDAVTVAGKNTCDGTSIVLDSTTDIVFGTWNQANGTFTTPASSPNAVRVYARRLAARNSAIPLYFAQLIGKSTCDVSTQATAATNGGSATQYGIVGLESINMSGNASTDSYNSANGVYCAASAGDYGSIASNGGINLNGNVHINGDARPGDGANLNRNGNASVTGITTNLSSALSYPSVSAGSYATTNDNSNIPSQYLSGGNFNLSGNNTVDVPAGIYYFSNFSMSGNSTLNINGDVTFYVNGNFGLSGNVDVNVAQSRPTNFKIRMVCSAGVNLSGNSGLCADVYAPQSPINLSGNGDFYGTLVGKSLSLSGNGDIHYDQSISTSPGSAGTSVALVD